MKGDLEAQVDQENPSRSYCCSAVEFAAGRSRFFRFLTGRSVWEKVVLGKSRYRDRGVPQILGSSKVAFRLAENRGAPPRIDQWLAEKPGHSPTIA
jgi:hypothetical protein